MMFYFYIPEGICFAAFVPLSCTWLHYARFHCVFLLCFFVSFLILVSLFACLPFLVVLVEEVHCEEFQLLILIIFVKTPRIIFKTLHFDVTILCAWPIQLST
jgi:hypothetical protein